METVLNVLLIRFGIIAGLIVVAGLMVCLVIVVLRRRGKGDRVRTGAATVVRYAARGMDERSGRGRAARDAAQWLEGRRDER